MAERKREELLDLLAALSLFMMLHQEDSDIPLINMAYLSMFVLVIGVALQVYELLKHYRQLQGNRKELQAEVEKLRARVEAEAAARQEVKKREVQLLEQVKELAKTTEELQEKVQLKEEELEKVGAELISAKGNSSALLLQWNMLQAELERRRELCREHSTALVRSGEHLVGAKSLVKITVTRVGELDGRLVVLQEEKVGAEVQAAEVKLEDALAAKCKVEEQLEAKCNEFGGLASWPVQLEEQVRAYDQQLQEAREREAALLAEVYRALH